jgi:putative PIN family toxin of toxin-antitoxin system
MIRVVVDTNVIVSALLRSGGLPEAVFNLAMVGEIILLVSEPVLAEYEEVLRRPRLKIDSAKVTDAMVRIRAVGSLLVPTQRVTAASDPDDNIFLECAQAGNAEYLVTGNVRDFPETWQRTRILTPREFVEMWAALSD